MTKLPKTVIVIAACSVAGVAWVVQSSAQQTAVTNDHDPQEAPVEASVLIPPRSNATADRTPATTDRQLVVNEANQPEALPPPRRPESRPAVRPTTRLARRQPFLRPAEPEPADSSLSPQPAEIESMPIPDSPEMVIQPTPPIAIDTDRDARRMYRSFGEVELIMTVRNPANGCLYEIPLCIPACCTGEPVVDERRGLFGRGVVEYCWECGFEAKVIFRHVLGDVKVEYDG
jgi:hypothetical protein